METLEIRIAAEHTQLMREFLSARRLGFTEKKKRWWSLYRVFMVIATADDIERLQEPLMQWNAARAAEEAW